MMYARNEFNEKKGEMERKKNISLYPLLPEAASWIPSECIDDLCLHDGVACCGKKSSG